MSNGLSNNEPFFPLGDSGLLIDFGNTISATLNQQVLHLFEILQNARLPWITDLVPAYSSLAIFYDGLQLATSPENPGTAYGQAVRQLQSFLDKIAVPFPSVPRRQLRIPVCYEGDFAPDLEEVATLSGLAADEVIRLHSAIPYRVYMIGFLPGFAYMGEVPETIAVARRSEPRTNVPAGSVGIAGRQTGIYPFESPGGWQLIGQTPLPLFQKEKDPPTLFAPGDEIIFYPITIDEFTHYQGGYS